MVTLPEAIGRAKSKTMKVTSVTGFIGIFNICYIIKKNEFAHDNLSQYVATGEGTPGTSLGTAERSALKGDEEAAAVKKQLGKIQKRIEKITTKI